MAGHGEDGGEDSQHVHPSTPPDGQPPVHLATHLTEPHVFINRLYTSSTTNIHYSTSTPAAGNSDHINNNSKSTVTVNNIYMYANLSY